MIEMMQTEDCLNSQTCCEGGRRPERTIRTWEERKLSSREEPFVAIGGVDARDIPFTQKEIDAVNAVSSRCEVNQVIQERMSLYGPPEVNLDCIARHWQAYLDNRNSGPLTLQDVCNMMCLAKISRMARTPEHPDSVKDIKAYRQIAEQNPPHHQTTL